MIPSTFSTRVITRTPPEVAKLLEHHRVIESLFDDTPYTTTIKDWLKPIIDLSAFHVYPINGITEGLNYWMGTETRRIGKSPGDYEWVDGHTKNTQVHYLSGPSAITGNHIDIPTDRPVVLDLAYVGTTANIPIPMTDNIERVFYSLSKPFGLKNVRTGWMFTRKPNPKLTKLHLGANYYNYIAHAVAEAVIERFPVDYTYQYYREAQLDVCARYDLIPCDSVWLATTTDPTYIEYRRRGSEFARVCITGEYR